MKFISRRLGYATLVMFLASLVTFFALRVAPGSVTSSLLNPSTVTPERVAALEKSLGLDDPAFVQYGRFMGKLLSGDLGNSIVSRVPVAEIIAHSAGYTVVLALASFALAFGLGVPAGVIAAIRKDSIVDRAIRVTASFLLAMPNFVLALLLILLFGVLLHTLPVSGANSWQSLILPAVALGAEPAALTARVTRTAFLEQRGMEFVTTLRARGVSERRINWRHVLRNSLSSIISLGAVQIRNLLGYALIVEVIFRWPGLGYQLVQSILTRDYGVAQVLAILLALVVVISSALGDWALRIADPRVRLSGKVS